MTGPQAAPRWAGVSLARQVQAWIALCARDAGEAPHLGDRTPARRGDLGGRETPPATRETAPAAPTRHRWPRPLTERLLWALDSSATTLPDGSKAVFAYGSVAVSAYSGAGDAVGQELIVHHLDASVAAPSCDELIG